MQAMKDGAVDFLSKPVKDQRVIDAVVSALEKDAMLRASRRKQNELQSLYNLLTPREREVIHYVVEGLMNKQIATRMHLSEITIKIHRSTAMRKMEAGSVAELVRKIEALITSEEAML
ncbi:hypothetical protein PBP221_76190 (plasmid) [Paraburkholderia sp. 22B1P]|nr:hypothetical protein PBP221_76190 [Paraburkholderia sp. 22B1P]